jgi:creatinine deaminase
VAAKFDGGWSMVAVTTRGHCGTIDIGLGVKRGRIYSTGGSFAFYSISLGGRVSNSGGVSLKAVAGPRVAVGHNRRFQRGSNILHGEMDCIENAGHLVDFSKTILFTTLSPCLMCAHTVLLFRIPTVIILDDVNTQDFVTSVDKLKAEGIEVIVERHEPSIELNRRFQTEFRNKWLGDVGLE